MFRINKSVTFTCIALLICLILLVNSTLSMRTNNEIMELPDSYSPEYERLWSSRPRFLYPSAYLRPYRAPFYQDTIEKKNRKIDQSFYSYYG
ncbi:unnamed protein product [Schistosoma guineensis]|uniref:Uncharacterized protein n=2 Tax=Schistosoma haematobium TaxID=6185 RepID=A0A922LZV7_SCHHA|nr:hypothetical protein MS3_00010241 [Schistosoma haematobium]CAH8483563.1 unnamed protein product [Schistosoma intercalatum]CAH8484204.1 unnamed protein product [Schistosoma guineensis]CAH8488729.1 unnamed protein product [Schistosoma bovis]KAH9596754.1 hypothetical protein MS3_00010241 [Schistosoma haematobium]CAH8490104.1 unnamed protein product [Schistosoma bovis]